MPYDVEQLKTVISLDSDLNQLQDVDMLLECILSEARKIVNADAGTIYVIHGDHLAFTYAQNDTKQRKLSPGQKLIYQAFTVPINPKSIAGYVAFTGEAVNIPDVYNIPKHRDYGFDPSYDVVSGYRSHSMLVIPLKSYTGQLLGVIQVINKMDRSQAAEPIPFNHDDELLVSHFASNATVALQRAQMTRAILLRMIRMAELRDPKETGPHANRVAGYSVELYEAWATSVGIARKEIERTCDSLRMAAMLHDVGKVAIPDMILRKPDRFTDEEYAIMKTHTWQGARLFVGKQSEFDELAYTVALTHHENWDGTGYPGYVDPETGAIERAGPDGNALGKRGDDIPIFGRIVSIADVYDALLSSRVYKQSWSEDDALREMKSMAGTKFDPKLIELFFSILPNIRTITDKYTREPETPSTSV